MPKRPDIKKVLVIGSGPIVIGQAAEFDYSGSQACASLREEGVKTVLINSNPATIQTDKDTADIVYIEPLRIDFIEKIIARERPDGIIATMGGQTGLNLGVQLAEAGILDKYKVEFLGTDAKAIADAEDRKKFNAVLDRIHEPYLESVAATSVEQGLEFAKKHTYPLVLRPAYTLGGTGGRIAYNEAELIDGMKLGLTMSQIGQVLVEECVSGWGEIEYEVMRDGYDNCITVCNMENVDPMGIHTGESIVTAPSQTLSDKDYQILRNASIKIVCALNIKGGCNIQFSLNQQTGEYYVIEVNPRLSRSSALASKATGYPIARVAAKIALGYALHEIPNAVTKKTPASFEPAIDYVVLKVPRWPFDKMPESDRHLGTQMKSTGEVMAIGRNFEEALNKSIRSIEVRKRVMDVKEDGKELEDLIIHATDRRLFAMLEALRKGWGVEKVSALSRIHPWFIQKMKNITDMEKRLKVEPFDRPLLLEAKKMGFGDLQIAELTNNDESAVRKARIRWGVKPVYKMVDTCAAEFAAETPYYYSTYDSECESVPDKKKKVIVIGGGPIRIGQGIEFDYCCCHASFALREAGVQSIMINNNPETVSTDFDASDKLYFEPLAFEDVMNVIEKEQPFGVIVQFGGQTSINLANRLHEAGVPILGTGVEGIDLAEDRERFRVLLNSLGILQPKNGTASNEAQALKVAEHVGYPVVVRPSYVIAGRGMEIVHDAEQLSRYITEAVEVSERRPVLIDKFIDNAKEVEIDGVSDSKRLFIGGIMEHIEKAGVHSGDANCVTPPISLDDTTLKTIIDYSNKISRALHNIGAINIQYAVQDGKVFVLEANPRASRTMPYLSKATGIPLAKIATRVLLGQSLDELNLHHTPKLNYFAVKSVVFPFLKLVGTDIILGPEMKSTGESMGIDHDFGRAFYKALLGANQKIPLTGSVALSLRDEDKQDGSLIAAELCKLGYTIYATPATARALSCPVQLLKKIADGEPNIVSEMRKKNIQIVINTPKKGKNSFTDGFKIRRAALENNVPVITRIEAAKALVEALKAAKNKELTIQPVSEFY